MWPKFIAEWWRKSWNDCFWEDEEMATTAQKLDQLLALENHNHLLLHLLLRMQGATKEQLEILIAAHEQNDDAAWERLVGELKKPTEQLDATIKANQ